jgi:hypothetical protein
MGQSFEEAKSNLLSRGRPGKLVLLDDGSWDVLPLPDKDPVIEKRKQEIQLAKAHKEAMRIRLEEEQARRDEAYRMRLQQMEIEQQAKREQEQRMLLLRKEREAKRMQQLKDQAIKRAEELEALRREQLQQASKKLLDLSSHSISSGLPATSRAKNDDFSISYRAAIETTLRRFVENGNDVACTGVYIYEYGSCELCGHQQIKWHYILENLSSRNQIVVGSECVRNYKIILEEWGYRPAYVVFPECLRKFTPWILEEDSGAVRFSDAVACFYTRNPRDRYGIMQADQKLQMFTFAKKLHGMLVASDARREPHEIPI